MEKHANNSHLLPSTPTQRVVRRKKILWHYLNGFVSIGESKERVKWKSATIVHFWNLKIVVFFFHTPKNRENWKKFLSWRRRRKVLSRKTNADRKTYEVGHTRASETIRDYFYDHFSSFVLNWASFDII